MTTITSSTNNGIYIGDPPSTNPVVIIDPGVTVTGKANDTSAIVVYYSGWTITNAGSIEGYGGLGFGVDLKVGGRVNNTATGRIESSQAAAVYITGGSGTVFNSGIIVTPTGPGALGRYAGVGLISGGYVSNAKTGTIAANHGPAIYVTGGSGTIFNAGSIYSSSRNGISLRDGGAVTNLSTGTISSSSTDTRSSPSGRAGFAVAITDAAGTVINAGVILSSGGTYAAVELLLGGYVNNSRTGTISSNGQYGVYATGAVAGVINAGTIAGGETGVALESGGTVLNSGTVSGLYAVSFSPGYTSRLVVDPGAVFDGTVNGGNWIGDSTVTTLELASGASTGTLSGLGTQFIDFEQIIIDPGASWVLGSDDWLASGVTLTNAGTLAGTITIASGGVFTNVGGGTIAASGLVEGKIGYGVYLPNGGIVTNPAGETISGSMGGVLVVGLPGTVVNGGIITATGAGGFGVQVDGGTLSNTGTIAGASYFFITGGVGVYLTASGTLINCGTISGGHGGGGASGGAGVTFTTGTLSNSGMIAGGGGGGGGNGGTGVSLTAGTLANSGTIAGGEAGGGGDGGVGVTFTAGSVSNSGTISGGGGDGDGAGVAFTTGILSNSGAISGGDGGTGVTFTAGTLSNSGTISGEGGGGGVAFTTGTLSNSGTISGGVGIVGNGGAGVTLIAGTLNNSGGITGGATEFFGVGGDAVSLAGGATLSNSGNITGGSSALGDAGGAGVSLAGGAALSNFGYIVGGFGDADGSVGVHFQGGGTLTNAGSISGAGTADAVNFGTGAARLVLDPGASFTGDVVADALDNNVLELASGGVPGTLSGFGAQFVNFGKIVVDQGASWDLNSSDTFVAGETLTDNGTLQFGAGTLANAAAMTIDSSTDIPASTTITGGADWSGTGALVVGAAGAGSFLVNNQAAASFGGLDIGQQVSSSGDVTVTGTKSELSNTGRFIVGDAGLGSLSIESDGTVITSTGTAAGLSGAIIANTASASGSFVDLTGAGSSWQIGGTLIVGNAGFGDLSLSQGASVTATSLDMGAAAGGDGIVSIVGTNTALNLTGNLTVGDQSTGELTILSGAKVSGANGNFGGSSAASPSSVDIEGASSQLTLSGTLAIGETGPAVFTLGQNTVLNLGGNLITGIDGTFNQSGTVDPPNVLNDGVTNLTGGAATLADISVENSGEYTVKNGPVSIYTPLVTDDPNPVTDLGSTTGLWQIDTLGTLVLNTTSVDASQTIQFNALNGVLVIGQQPDIGLGGTVTGTVSPGDPNVLPGFDAPIQNFKAGDEILFTGLVYGSDTQVANTVTLWSGAAGTGTDLGSLSFITLSGGPSTSEAVLAAAQIESNATALCFLAGTLIQTPSGEREVERLAVGDSVVTASGVVRPIEWIGVGKVLATRGRRGAATPVIVRKGALGANVPYADLRVTKGHSLLLDGVLIPVEFLVNHRSILWDDRAQEVSIYHVELATHDVLVANGAAAESYRDDGNRWLFQNGNAGWGEPPKPPCVPVLTGGPVVDAVWRRLLDAAGPRPNVPLTENPDIHLMVDGVRVDATQQAGEALVFALPAPSKEVRLVSRSVVPQELGLARDARELGVALRSVAVRQSTKFCTIKANDTRLMDGFHPFEAETGARWTDGHAALPSDLFAGFEGPVEVVLTLAVTARYPNDDREREVA